MKYGFMDSEGQMAIQRASKALWGDGVYPPIPENASMMPGVGIFGPKPEA